MALNLPQRARRGRADPDVEADPGHPAGVLGASVGSAPVHVHQQRSSCKWMQGRRLPASRRRSPCTSPIAGSRSSRRGGGDDEVTLAWLADQLRAFVDLNPEFECRSSAWPPGWPGWTTKTVAQLVAYVDKM